MLPPPRQPDDQLSAAERTRRYFATIQDENGVDMTLIHENLRLSPHQRLLKAELGRLQALRLRNHAQRRTSASA